MSPKSGEASFLARETKPVPTPAPLVVVVPVSVFVEAATVMVEEVGLPVFKPFAAVAGAPAGVVKEVVAAIVVGFFFRFSCRSGRSDWLEVEDSDEGVSY